MELTKGETLLIGVIIRSAIINYNATIPEIDENTSPDEIRRITQLKKDKANAEWFFKYSRLFKLSQISFDYLQDCYERGVISSYDRKD